jgi:hypothetical protein
MTVSAELQCSVVWIGYDFATRTGTLVTAPNSCCDIQACIRYFQLIDEHVQRIKTYTGDNRDAVYTLESGGWITTLPGRAYA